MRFCRESVRIHVFTSLTFPWMMFRVCAYRAIALGTSSLSKKYKCRFPALELPMRGFRIPFVLGPDVSNGAYASYSASFGAVVGLAYEKTRAGDTTSDWGGSVFWGYQVSAGVAVCRSKTPWAINMGKCPCNGEK